MTWASESYRHFVNERFDRGLDEHGISWYSLPEGVMCLSAHSTADLGVKTTEKCGLDKEAFMDLLLCANLACCVGTWENV